MKLLHLDWIVNVYLLIPLVACNSAKDSVAVTAAAAAAKAKELENELAGTASALEDVAGFFWNNPAAITEDVKLGVLLAVSNADIQPLRLLSSQMADSSAPLVELFRRNLTPGEPLKYELVNSSDTEFILPRFNSCQSVDRYMMMGTPNDSDLCINQLITRDCRVSRECFYSMTNDEPHSGYKTSHRLLYFIAAAKLGCSEKVPGKFFDVQARRRKLCQQMWHEGKNLFGQPEFHRVTMDVFLEQIALCGYLGHAEFANQKWRKALRKWHSDNLCFLGRNFLDDCSDQTSSSSLTTKRVRRMDTLVDDCHTHTGAAGLAAMAFHFRFLKESLYPSPNQKMVPSVS